MLKIKTFDSVNRCGRESKPKIRMGKSGYVYITKKASDMLELSIGDKVSLHQDEENPRDWFISKDKNGIKLRGKKEDGVLIFHLAQAVKKLFSECEITAKSISFVVSKTPIILNNVKYYPIITSSAK